MLSKKNQNVCLYVQYFETIQKEWRISSLWMFSRIPLWNCVGLVFLWWSSPLVIFSGYFIEIGLVKLLVTNGANLGTVFYLDFHIYFYRGLRNSLIVDSISSISMVCPPCQFLFCTFMSSTHFLLWATVLSTLWTFPTIFLSY